MLFCHLGFFGLLGDILLCIVRSFLICHFLGSLVFLDRRISPRSEGLHRCVFTRLVHLQSDSLIKALKHLHKLRVGFGRAQLLHLVRISVLELDFGLFFFLDRLFG